MRFISVSIMQVICQDMKLNYNLKKKNKINEHTKPICDESKSSKWHWEESAIDDKAYDREDIGRKVKSGIILIKDQKVQRSKQQKIE